jgi:hypothetical protein
VQEELRKGKRTLDVPAPVSQRTSDVLALASGQKPGQARPEKARARPGQRVWLRLWPGLDYEQARAGGLGHGFVSFENSSSHRSELGFVSFK